MTMCRSIVSLMLCVHFYSFSSTPQVSIIIVVDQFADHSIEKVRPYLKGGLRFLLDEGIVYKQAHTPYAWPSTGSGHATLNTGVLPKDHGIVHNKWGYKPDGTFIRCDDGTPDHTAVFGLRGLQPYGKSAEYVMVDGISDQFAMQTQHKNYQAYAISLKSRAAICAANKLGKAIWFDPQTGMMTSSKAYFQSLPEWLKEFNHKKNIAYKPYTWRLCYGHLPAAYGYKNVHNYKGAMCKQRHIGKTISPKESVQESYKDFILSPAANKLVFDAALACIDAHMYKKRCDEKLFLWVLPSALDHLGHLCGPNVIEIIDMIYHLDMQLKKFMDCVNKKVCKQNVLWALTADHGVTPLPEQIRGQGYFAAHRHVYSEIKKQTNDFIKDNFGIEHAIIDCNANAIYLNHGLFSKLDHDKRITFEQAMKGYLQAQPGIKKIWSRDQLKNSCFQPGTLDLYCQNQLFKGRNGDLIIQAYPYNTIAPHTAGATHHGPYDYNTHIPLILYQYAHYHRKIIYERVYNTQFAPTIAHILGIPQPSACTAAILPGIVINAGS